MPPKILNNQAVKWQISELLRLNAGARSINSNPPVYEIPIPTIYGRLTLHVAFPETSNQSVSAPLNVAPTIQVASLVDHPWLDDDMYFTHHASINQWNSQSNIGLIVREIVTEWTANPPMPLQANKQSTKQANKQANNGQSSIRSNSQDEWVMVDEQRSGSDASNQSTSASNQSSNQSSNQPNNQSSNRPNKQSNALMLPIPSSFDWIDKMSVTELERIWTESNGPDKQPASNDQSPTHTISLSTNQAVIDSLHQHSSVTHIEQVKAGLFESLDKCALSNIDQSDQYNRLVDRLNEARKQASQHVTNQQALLERQQKLLQKFTPRAVIQLLDQAVNQSEERCLTIQEAYLNGEDQAVNQPNSQPNNQRHARFIEAYVKERSLLHLRQAKRERAVAMID